MGFPISDTSSVTTEMRGNYIGPDEIAALIAANATARATRYQTLLSEYRPDDAEGTMTPFTAPADPAPEDIGWRALVVGAVLRLPTPLPGSASQTGASSGGSATTRGELAFAARLSAAEAFVRVRSITVAGGSSTLGTPTYATLQRSTASLAWVSTTCLLPTGVAPGDDICIDIYWRQYVADTEAKCGGWLVAEPVLSSIDP